MANLQDQPTRHDRLLCSQTLASRHAWFCQTSQLGAIALLDNVARNPTDQKALEELEAAERQLQQIQAEYDKLRRKERCYPE